MILPTKHIPARHSLLGLGGLIMRRLESPKTVSALWDKVREDPDVRTFKRYILALDLLYLIGIIEYHEGQVQRAER